MKLTPAQRIERVHVSLMRDKQFCLFSGLFMIGKTEVVDNIPTAATDGVNVKYGSAFVDSLNDKQLAFLVLHETMHKAYRHLTVWDKLYKKNHMLANMACDYVINLQIKDYDPEGRVVEMPTDKDGKVLGCIDEKYRGMDAAQVFAELEKDPPPPPPDGGGDCEGGAGLDQHEWGKASEVSPEEAEQIAKEIDHALRQGALLAGKMNGEVSAEIKDLLNPKVDWREALREIVKAIAKGHDDSSWRKYNRRFIGSDIYMPTPISTRVGRIVLAQDTSGSVFGEPLIQFMSEVNSITQEVTPEAIDLLYWDSRVASHEVFEGHEVSELIAKTKPRGGGGTSPECIPAYLKEKDMKPECVIVLTDGCFYEGEGEWGEVECPIIWAIIGNKNFSAKRGIVLHIEEK
jgi:predicted metal-dependent peptidase